MNSQINQLAATAWYWKKFYWKIFATFDKAISAAVIAGMATADADIFNTHTDQLIIFWMSVQIAGVTAVDALIDNTFSSLSASPNNPNGNGHSAPAPITETQTTQQTQNENKVSAPSTKLSGLP